MRFIKELKLNFLLNSILSIALGVFFLIWPGAVQAVIVYAVGIIILLLAIGWLAAFIRIHAWTIGGVSNLIAGVLLLMLAFNMLTQPEAFKDNIIRLVGFFVIINGFMGISQATNLKNAGYGKWWLSFVFAMATTILGILIFFDPTFAGNFAVQVIGVILIYNGASNIWISTRVHKFVKKAEKVPNTIDVEYTETDASEKDEQQK